MSISPINRFLLDRNLRIASNPCVSPDFCLDWPALKTKLLAGEPMTVWEKSRFESANGSWRLLEDPATGDCAWRHRPQPGKVGGTALEDGAELAGGVWVFPATFANLLKLKNLVQPRPCSWARAPSASVPGSPHCTGRPSNGP